MTRAAAALALPAAAALLAGCTPDLDGRPSELVAPRVLAVQAEPAEAEPRSEITLRALWASPDGAPPPPLDWAFCLERKPLTELGPIAPACLRPEGGALAPLGAGLEVAGALPEDGCRLFGPDRPEPEAGEPAGRAVDPDPTGGYYQPARLLIQGEAGASYATFGARITCGVAGATPAQAAEYRSRYRPNENPRIASLSWLHGDAAEELTPDDPAALPAITVSPGEALTLRAAWDACPDAPACGDGICGEGEDAAGCAADCDAPRGCAGAEPYVAFDLEAGAIRRRREGIAVSWFASAGALSEDRTGRAEDEAVTTSDNVWTAPDEAGEARLWAVIRDDRGGVGWQAYRIAVAP